MIYPAISVRFKSLFYVSIAKPIGYELNSLFSVGVKTVNIFAIRLTNRTPVGGVMEPLSTKSSLLTENRTGFAHRLRTIFHPVCDFVKQSRQLIVL